MSHRIKEVPELHEIDDGKVFWMFESESKTMVFSKFCKGNSARAAFNELDWSLFEAELSTKSRAALKRDCMTNRRSLERLSRPSPPMETAK